MTVAVIPSYKVRNHILDLLRKIGPEVDTIYVVDDRCPEGTGNHVREHCKDSRVRVLRHEMNKGVGGAVKTGYMQALKDGADIIVKLDGDGQMDPGQIPALIKPIRMDQADYTKGNRFFDIATLESMPRIRLIGNSILSLVNKIVSGYWNIMDPTNGFTAIHAAAAGQLPLDKIADRYFFESDMLFRLGTMRAVVADVPMKAAYANEVSNLSIRRVLVEFPPKYFSRMLKRIFYNYFLRDFNIGTLEIITGMLLVLAGTGMGLYHWYKAAVSSIVATSGTVMLSALPVILGFQLLLAALHYDIQNVPSRTLSRPD